jgi:hypothetical protein
VFPRISHICQPDSKESLGPPEFIGTQKNETPTSILQLKHKILQHQTQNIRILQYYANAPINIIGNCCNMIAMILFRSLGQSKVKTLSKIWRRKIPKGIKEIFHMWSF